MMNLILPPCWMCSNLGVVNLSMIFGVLILCIVLVFVFVVVMCCSICSHDVTGIMSACCSLVCFLCRW